MRAPVATLWYIRREARRYVAELLEKQDMPDWPYERGLFDVGDAEAERVFLDEVHRCGARIKARGINP